MLDVLKHKCQFVIVYLFFFFFQYFLIKRCHLLLYEYHFCLVDLSMKRLFLKVFFKKFFNLQFKSCFYLIFTNVNS